MEDVMNDRIIRLRAEMERAELDAVLLKTVTAIRYFSGFTSEDASVLITKNRAVLLTDFRYTLRAEGREHLLCRPDPRDHGPREDGLYGDF